MFYGVNDIFVIKDDFDEILDPYKRLENSLRVRRAFSGTFRHMKIGLRPEIEVR